MTLNDIIVSALIQTGHGHDAQTMDIWRDKLTLFANDAIVDLSNYIKPTKTERVSINGGEIDCLNLSRECVRVMKVKINGSDVPFYESETKIGSVRVDSADGEADITYRFIPKRLSNASDEPELGEAAGQLIVTYVVARERASGDAANQRGGNIYFQLYEAGKSKLRPHMGADDSYLIRNRW